MENGNRLGKDAEEYIKRFYENKFTAYDFMTLFCAIYAIQKRNSFSRDNLLAYIINCKEAQKFESLLEDIALKNNGVFYYSENLMEATTMLKNVGILYTISPEGDSSIYIRDDVSVSSMIKTRLDYMDAMVAFVAHYQHYEIEAIKRAHHQFVSQEPNDIERTVGSLSRVLNKKQEDKPRE